MRQNDVLICFVRNDGRSKLSMITIKTGSNIVLEPVLIVLLQMGILGAVLAAGLASVMIRCF